MDLQTAVDNYGRAMTHCDNIIAIHRGHGGGGPGRRIREVSLDRAVIVLAVAAWQAAVQDLTAAILDECQPKNATQADIARYKVTVGAVRNAIEKFATPNGDNVRNLMVGAGFDPWPHWTYSISAGRGRPHTNWTRHMVNMRLNEWLKVRHHIAHGHETLPEVQALEAVRLDKISNPSVRLADAEQCVSFMDRLVKLTAQAVADHLGTTVVTPRGA
ncbi:hypothetical protein LG314_07885 [Agrococcus terreus]|uniref:hypothetical protein n=1 Tax=Agrococcus terreus TaxID=574649 RepID=UPI00384F4EE0